MAKARFAACFEHRGEAQAVNGITANQQAALSLGREPGTNHRTGYVHREESKRKASRSHKEWCANNPDKVKARAEKNRGENHYRWNGGSSKLNIAVRQLTENRKWMDAVKARDGECVICGTVDNLEAHHLMPLARMLERNGINNREQARGCDELWDLNNGVTVCQCCHYGIHGRKYENQ